MRLSSYKVSGVDSETRGLRLFQCGRPIEIGAMGDKFGGIRTPLRFGGKTCKRAGRGNSAVTRLGEDSEPLPARCNSGPHFVTTHG